MTMLRIGFLAGGLSAVAALALSGFAASAADVAPKVDTSQPTPVVYPTTAQRAGEEGTVLLNVYVTYTGRPQKIDIARSSGYSELDNAAVETAANWHYVPALHDGDTASDWASVKVVYRMPEQASNESR
jgi:TonB family protein